MAHGDHRCSVCRHSRAADRRLVSSFLAYICERCLAEAPQHSTNLAAAGTCAFCGLPSVDIAAAWTNFHMCRACLSLGREVIADDDRLVAQAT